MKIKLAVMLIIMFCALTACDDVGLSEVPLEDGEVRIALIDTGVSLSVIEDEHILSGYNYVKNSADTNDNIGHGTSIAGILLGSSVTDNNALIEDINIVPLVIQDEVEGEFITVDKELLAKAVYDAVDVFNCRVINMSLGTQEYSKELYKAIEYAYEKGVVIVSAVGNTGDLYPKELYYPAAFEEVIGVGSVNLSNEVSSFSQKNNTVSLMGYGEGYYVAMPNGDKLYASGTSYAVPYISAAAASAIKQNAQLSAKEVTDLLIENALDIEDTGYDIKSGYGICRQFLVEP